MSSDGTCPICVGKMDQTDQQFKPCNCGYKICAFCYNRILNNNNPSCPACRRPYDPNITPPVYSPIISSPASSTKSHKHKSSKTTKRQQTTTTTTQSSHSQKDIPRDELHHSQLTYDELSNIRVRQQNLVYVVGLPIALCDENTLKTSKWFGGFGKIKKVYCNKKTSHAQRTGSFAAFITFYRDADAMKAISTMNGKYLDDGKRVIKATTGSTKYCSYFLRGASCSNPSCLYLHEWARTESVVTKEELNDFGGYHHSHHHNGGNGLVRTHSEPIRYNNSHNAMQSISDNEMMCSAVNGGDDLLNSNRTVLSSKKHHKNGASADRKIAKFDYTKRRILSEHVENVQTAEYPPLGAGSMSTTPSPSMTHKQLRQNMHKTPPARPQKTRTKPPMSIHRKHGLVHPQMSSSTSHGHIQQSKSEKLCSKSQDNAPPKMALNEKKSVNFDAFVDIVGDDVTKSKMAICSRQVTKTKTKTKPRSKSVDKTMTSTQSSKGATTTNMQQQKIKKRSSQSQRQKRSHRAVAKILLEELMGGGSGYKRNGKKEGFRLSDLLKDGMLSSDELMIEREQSDYYNYYYFLQSDKQIYQQFHKQFFDHDQIQFGNGRKLQKMQKTNA